MVVKKRRKQKEGEFIENESLLKFVEFLVFHIFLTLMIIRVVIRSEEMAAELASIANATVSYLFFVSLSFNVELKLLGTGKIGVTVITARPWRIRDRNSD